MATRKFNVDHPQGKFLIVVSEQTPNFFVSTAVFYTKSGDGQRGNLSLNVDAKNFHGTNHTQAYDAAKSWMRQTLGAAINIEEVVVVEQS
ncbi:hypothetical protein HA052_19710 [Chromobacterium haemolyticum]|uniref:Uncharacterized protein n=1 Tax=Chromobacterium fluminis TaxID=3044269 RepID=A0ABX0LDC7_9NEIS|nr:hypothetical protein [Chromobacterium haemolyticum]NHR07421.1 hypothetical protein [Chromobacterium haemolyticum]